MALRLEASRRREALVHEIVLVAVGLVPRRGVRRAAVALRHRRALAAVVERRDLSAARDEQIRIEGEERVEPVGEAIGALQDRQIAARVSLDHRVAVGQLVVPRDGGEILHDRRLADLQRVQPARDDFREVQSLEKQQIWKKEGLLFAQDRSGFVPRVSCRGGRMKDT